MDGRKFVAWNLRRLRVQRDISQETLGLEADVDRTYVGRLERGLENPTVGLLDRLAAALTVNISEFFLARRLGEPTPKPLSGGRRGKRAGSRKKRRVGK
jgi:transcriptional regulator with XRE-family HTH domain